MSTTTAPKFALALGSGGLKSIAALGVAEILAREGLAPDLIVGSSAGAVFGAVLATGCSAEEAASLATRLWSREVTSQRRWRAWPQLLLPRLSGFSEHFSLRDDRLVNARLQQAFGDTRLQDLPTRLAVNATDALRASIALPFLFAPKALDGLLLVDGSLSDPVPVALAGRARLVVAVGFKVPQPRLAPGHAHHRHFEQQPDGRPARRAGGAAPGVDLPGAGTPRRPVRHRGHALSDRPGSPQRRGGLAAD